MNPWPELSSLTSWRACDLAARGDVEKRLLDRLGPEFVPAKSAGREGFPSVHHARIGIDLIAVPGGSLLQGLRDDEVDELRLRVFGPEDTGRFERECAGFRSAAAPLRTVEVSPFLCARSPLGGALIRTLGLEASLIDFDALFRAANARSAATTLGFRLLTEAEWEWIAREGGVRSWIIEIPDGVHGENLDFLDTSAPSSWHRR
jgi:hypothetical protein